MTIGKIFIGVAVIVIGLIIWFSLFGGLLDIFVSSPQERYRIREALREFQLIYFLILIVSGLGLILWGAQT